MKKIKYALIAPILLHTSYSYAQITDVDIYGSTGNFGGVGLLEMRNARFSPDGELAVGISYVKDSKNYSINWQATPWLETTLRFSDYNNDRYGIDKGLDVKLRLFKEGKILPAIAIGLQDMLGDGLFSGEYLVASKAIWMFDVTTGFGFGNLASRARISNVFAIFGDEFKTRTFENSNSEKLRLGNYFSGEKMGFFAGVEYKTPVEGLTAKVEYSTVDKSLLDIFDDYESKTAFNFGVNYKANDWFEVGAGLHHGNQIALQFTLKQNLHKPMELGFASGHQVEEIRSRELRNKPSSATDYKNKEAEDIIFDRLTQMGFGIRSLDVIDNRVDVTLFTLNEFQQSNVLVLGAVLEQYGEVNIEFEENALKNIRATTTDDMGVRSLSKFKNSVFYKRENFSTNISEASLNDINYEIYKKLELKGLEPKSVEIINNEIRVTKEVGPYLQTPKNIGRVARILTQIAPDNIERFIIEASDMGIAVSNVSILRKDIENLASYNGSPEEVFSNSEIGIPKNSYGNEILSSRIKFAIFPDVVTHFGSNKDDHFKADFNLIAAVNFKLTDNIRINAEAKQYIIGDLDVILPSNNPNVPHVRSDIGLYAKEGTTSIRRLTAEYQKSISSNVYTRLSAGHLEEMYSGISGEILYHPFASSIALGLDINYVKQRDYDQLFSMRDYQTVSGHATFYYVNKSYDITTKVSFGRYLAKDWGTTIDISREFDSGIRVGAMATFTNMSESDYGQGSFDKGIYMTIPFDFFWVKQSREKANFKIRRLGKNGGQKIDHRTSLFEILQQSQPYKITKDWHKIVE